MERLLFKGTKLASKNFLQVQSFSTLNRESVFHLSRNAFLHNTGEYDTKKLNFQCISNFSMNQNRIMQKFKNVTSYGRTDIFCFSKPGTLGKACRVEDATYNVAFRSSFNLSCKNFSSLTFKNCLDQARNIKFEIHPREMLVDEKMEIRVTDLQKFERITITAEIKEQGYDYGSIGHFIADSFGTVDLSSCQSLSGTYTGTDPMGLIWSIEAKPGQREGLRFFKKDVTTPVKVKFSVYKDFIYADKLYSEDHKFEPLFTVNVNRWYKMAGVQRIPIRQGNVRGVLFLPAGKGPFPGLIDMYGTAGGLLEYRASLLASHGFATFALAYFGYEDLPKRLDTLNLNYFEEAVKFIHGHPGIDNRRGIGVIGLSKGAEIACTMAEFFPEVSAVVSINGNIYNTFNPLEYNGNIICPGSEMNAEYLMFKDNVMNIRDCFLLPEANEKDYVIHVEKSNAKFLIIASENDECVSPLASYNVYNQLLNSDKSKNVEFLYLPGAGHLLDPPFSSLNNACYHKIFSCLLAFGGEKHLHAKGQEIAWEQILTFFTDKLVAISPEVRSKL